MLPTRAFACAISLIVLASCSSSKSNKDKTEGPFGGRPASESPEKSAASKTDSEEFYSAGASKKNRTYHSSSDDATLTRYKQAVAADIEAASKDYLHPSRPVEPLRAVIVFEMIVKSDGNATVKILRAPPDQEMQKRAMAIVKKAEPFPKPPGGKTIRFTETLLFDWPGMFRVRSKLES